MEETKKRTRKTAAIKEEKMAKKAPAAAKQQQRKSLRPSGQLPKNRKFFRSASWISISSVREPIMTFTKSWAHI